MTDFVMISMKTLIRNILNDKHEHCCLCLKSLDQDMEDSYSLEDQVFFEKDNNFCDIRNIISYVLGIEVSQGLSDQDQICNECNQSSIESYNFIKSCKDNARRLYDIIVNLNKTLQSFPMGYNKSVIFTVDPGNADVKAYLYNTKTISKKFVLKDLVPCDISVDFTQKSKEKIDSIWGIRSKHNKMSSVVFNKIKHYQCNSCELKTTSYAKMRQHFVNTHESSIHLDVKKLTKSEKSTKRYVNNNVLCDPDSAKSNDVYTLIQLNDKLRCKCEICDESFTDIKSLEDHYDVCETVIINDDYNESNEEVSTEIQEDIKKYKCKNCGSVFKSFKIMKSHYSKCCSTQSDGLICSVCAKAYTKRSALWNHEVRHHRKPITCTNCRRVYKNHCYYKKHVCDPSYERRKRSKRYKCNLCDKMFVSKESKKAHMRYMHSNGDLLCPYCGKRFPIPSSLKSHLLKHTQEKTICCDLCDEKFTTTKALQYHTRKHTGEKPYRCTYCNEYFMTASRRNEHCERFHNEPSHQCNICQKVFKAHRALTKHRRRHFNPNSTLYVREINIDT